MKYVSLCSGIEAASVAWMPLGWKPLLYSEIDPFARELLLQRYPKVPLYKHMELMNGDECEKPDLIVAGTPCQGFSIAGKREGLHDPRSQLVFEFLRIVQEMQPQWIVWENVPNVLHVNRGRDFGAFIGRLGQLGYGIAYRVLNAEYVRVDDYSRGLPQRRRRVFLCGYRGDWRVAGAVLFDQSSFEGNPPQATPLKAYAPGMVPEISAESNPANVTITVMSGVWDHSTVPCLVGAAPTKPTIGTPMVIELDTNRARKLTPLEVERAMGFPDGYTAIRYPKMEIAKDLPRITALGNSMPVNVMRWIGRRIEYVNDLREK